MSELSHIWKNEEGKRVKFTWIPGSRVAKFQPFTQCYAVAFVPDGKVVIGHRPGRPWGLPGGTNEQGETARQTLVRELDEELSLRVLRLRLLGAQRVEYLDEKKAAHYQLRYAAMVTLKTLTPDPDNGMLWERQSVPPRKVNDYLQWGPVFDEIMRLAERQYSLWAKPVVPRRSFS